jgi:hypothetical protein
LGHNSFHGTEVGFASDKDETIPGTPQTSLPECVCQPFYLYMGPDFFPWSSGGLKTQLGFGLGTSESSKAMDWICGHCIESKAIDQTHHCNFGSPLP